MVQHVLSGPRPVASVARALALLDELDPERAGVADFEVRRASLDDVFMTLTGHHTTSATESEPTDV